MVAAGCARIVPMMGWLEKLVLAWIPLFVAIDPVGLVPVFLGLTEGVAPDRRRRVIFEAVGTAAAVAVGFVFLGRFVFRALGISVADFQIAGGLILLVLAVRDLAAASSVRQQQAQVEDFGVVPLGLPLIAGPAMLTTLVILMDTTGAGITLAALAANMVFVAAALVCSRWIARLTGMTALRAFSKIVSLLLAAIAVSMIHRGWMAL